MLRRDFSETDVWITTSGIDYRDSVFIKTVFTPTLGFSGRLHKKILNHVNNIESVASNVRFYFMAFSHRIKSVFITVVLYIRALLHRKEPEE